MKIEFIILFVSFVLLHILEIFFTPYFSIYPFFVLPFILLLINSRFESYAYFFALIYGLILEVFFITIPVDNILPVFFVVVVFFSSYLFRFFGKGVFQLIILMYVLILALTFVAYGRVVMPFGMDKLFIFILSYVLWRLISFLEKTFR